MTPTYRVDPFPTRKELDALWLAAWDDGAPTNIAAILSRSLAHIAAYDGARLVGFVNVAWDGGIHAFILDTCVHPGWRRQGIATGMVGQSVTVAAERGARWLHVDFEAHLTPFYRSCGFRETAAGLMRLGGDG